MLSETFASSIDPACSIAFEAEPEEADVMLRPPRGQNRPLFDRITLSLSLLQGASVLIIVLAVFSASLYHGRGESEARAMTYTTLVIANLGLILTNRSWSRTIMETMSIPNPALWWLIGGAIVFLAVAVSVPFIRELFGFAALHLVDLAICFMAGMVSILWFECLKVIKRSANCP